MLVHNFSSLNRLRPLEAFDRRTIRLPLRFSVCALRLIDNVVVILEAFPVRVREPEPDDNEPHDHDGREDADGDCIRCYAHFDVIS